MLGDKSPPSPPPQALVIRYEISYLCIYFFFFFNLYWLSVFSWVSGYSSPLLSTSKMLRLNNISRKGSVRGRDLTLIATGECDWRSGLELVTRIPDNIGYFSRVMVYNRDYVRVAIIYIYILYYITLCSVYHVFPPTGYTVRQYLSNEKYEGQLETEINYADVNSLILLSILIFIK